MADMTTNLGASPYPSGYPAPSAPPAPPAATPDVRTNRAADSPQHPAPGAKPERNETVPGFNPSVTIDPDTHIVVMTIRSPDGQTVRQIPNPHELAAYKTNSPEGKKGA